MAESDYCFFHDPGKAAQRAAARKAGGEKGRALVLAAETPDAPLDTVGDVSRLLGQTVNQVRRGDLDPKIANAVGYLTGILLKALEVGEVERRLEALEEVVAERPSLLDDSDPLAIAS
jgi:hypothetical protein